MLPARILLTAKSVCCRQLSQVSKSAKEVYKGCYILCNQQKRFVSTERETPVKIYYGPLTPRMKAVKVFSLTTSLSGLAAQPILVEQGVKIGGTALAVFLSGFVGFFTFVTPILLHFITKKYVTEIHYDPVKNEYTATTLSLILTKIETKFKLEDVKVPEVPGMFTSFLVGKTPLFVEPSSFTDTDHYVKIMGYDKPIDFKLEPVQRIKETEERNKNT